MINKLFSELKLWAKLAVAAAAIVAFDFFLVCGGLPHSQMPPGWTVETNGSEYRFVRPDGNPQAVGTQWTRWGTVQRAWRQYRFESTSEGKWHRIDVLAPVNAEAEKNQ